MNNKTDTPMGSYTIDLPVNVKKDIDERVVSYWKDGESVLLQISSYARFEGKQVDAKERLKERIRSEILDDMQYETISIPSCSDVAAFSGKDKEGIKWLYCYVVWQDLTILFSISGNPKEIDTKGKWAFDAIGSVKRTQSSR